jgi:hypothetical protein
MEILTPQASLLFIEDKYDATLSFWIIDTYRSVDNFNVLELEASSPL